MAWLSLLLLSMAAQAAAVSDLHFQLPQPTSASDIEIWQLTESTQTRSKLLDTQIPGLLRLPQGCVENTAFVLRTDTAISRPVLIRSCPAREAFEVTLEPAARITGRLSTERPATDAESLTGQIHLVRCDDTFRFGVVPAWVEKEHLTAAVPGGCWDVTLRLAAATPITWPQRHVIPGETLNLGVIHPEPGAALVARVMREDGRPVAGAVLEVFPAQDFRQVAEQTFGSDLLEVGWPGRTDAAGWVRLAGLPGGMLRLRARSMAADLAPVFYGPFELAPETEVRLEDIVLPQAARISVGVDSTDARLADCELKLTGHLDPGCGWLNRTLLEATFADDGTAGPFSLAPGDWRLSVNCHHPRGTIFTVAREAISIPAGEETTYWLPVTGQLFYGRTLRGGEPVRAFLRLQPTEPERLQRVRLPTTYSDHEGAFVIGVPEPGEYQVWYRTAEQVSPLSLEEPVTLISPEKELELHLPDGSIHGIVVDAELRPVGNAIVVARRLGIEEVQAPGTASTREDGTFHLRNLQGGTWSLQAGVGEAQASKRFQASPRVRVVLAEEAEVKGIQLPLRAPTWLEVRVVDSQGAPIPRAEVAFRSESENPDGPSPERSLQTDSAGQVSLPILPEENGPYTLTVQAPQFQPTSRLVASIDLPVTIVLQPEIF